MVDLYAGGLKVHGHDVGGGKLLGPRQRSRDCQQGVDSQGIGRGSLSVDDDIEHLAGETQEFDDGASNSLKTDDTSLAWYARTPSTEQIEDTLRPWESLDLDAIYQVR